jgi:hypothetical protein
MNRYSEVQSHTRAYHIDLGSGSTGPRARTRRQLNLAVPTASAAEVDPR